MCVCTCTCVEWNIYSVCRYIKFTEQGIQGKRRKQCNGIERTLTVIGVDMRLISLREWGVMEYR